MVIFFPVMLKDLLVFGRNYPWPKPDSCPRCSNYRLWGGDPGIIDSLANQTQYRRPTLTSCRRQPVVPRHQGLRQSLDCHQQPKLPCDQDRIVAIRADPLR
jgi:hypothetical protein